MNLSYKSQGAEAISLEQESANSFTGVVASYTSNPGQIQRRRH